MRICVYWMLITTVDKTGSIFMLPLRKSDDERFLTCEMHNDMTATSITFIFTTRAFDWESFVMDCAIIVSGMRLLEHGWGVMACLPSVI